MTTQRELVTSSENSLAAFVTNALPQSNNSNSSPSHIGSFDSNTAQLNEEVKVKMFQFKDREFHLVIQQGTWKTFVCMLCYNISQC